MPLAPVEGTALNYRVDGVGDLPWLVLSNGLGTDLSMWEPQVTELSREFRVLRYDTRGHGASAISAGPFGIEHLGREVLALLDHVGARHAHFCGLSMGGMIGMWLGIHAPQRLQKLVLAHTAAWIGPQTMWDDRIEVVRAHGMAAISGAAIVRWFTPEFIVRAPGIVVALKASMERTSVDGYIGCCAAIRDADFRNDVTRITTPTLVISGTSDIATPPADGRFLASRIGGAESVELDAAHLSNVELPQDFTAALLRYLGSARASPSMQRTASAR